jgi:hypothetical protein
MTGVCHLQACVVEGEARIVFHIKDKVDGYLNVFENYQEREGGQPRLAISSGSAINVRARIQGGSK